jgi:hypothetical protein
MAELHSFSAHASVPCEMVMTDTQTHDEQSWFVPKSRKVPFLMRVCLYVC